ncbi:hypothetical protein [Methylobacterium sp. UNCCL110]|uniref:hypothetical protein n=1 Tax=Methylobacterium sp. UNCCL110 TaxID=1449057 RepID=UPI0012E09D0D|nr:hypothetical protein [Methylobacterium sp. UNCCL110]
MKAPEKGCFFSVWLPFWLPWLPFGCRFFSEWQPQKVNSIKGLTLLVAIIAIFILKKIKNKSNRETGG